MKTTNVMRGFKAMALSACFATMFLVGCEQPASVIGTDDAVAMSYAAKGSSSDVILAGDEKPSQDFGKIFARLNLTGEQRGQIEILRQQKIACEKAAKDALKASERAIQASFKTQRQAIEAGVKAGTITRDDARTQMRALEAAQKEAIKNNPARATAEAALKGCNDAFIAGVGALLTPEQKVIWDDFLANPPAKDGDKGGDHGHKGGGDKGGDHGHKDGGDKGRDHGHKGGDRGGK